MGPSEQAITFFSCAHKTNTDWALYCIAHCEKRCVTLQAMYVHGNICVPMHWKWVGLFFTRPRDTCAHQGSK